MEKSWLSSEKLCIHTSTKQIPIIKTSMSKRRLGDLGLTWLDSMDIVNHRLTEISVEVLTLTDSKVSRTVFPERWTEDCRSFVC